MNPNSLLLLLLLLLYLTANGLTPGGSSAATDLHTKSIQNTKNKIYIAKQKKKKNEKCGPCPFCASYTLAFALQLREKHGKTSVRVHPQLGYNARTNAQHTRTKNTIKGK